MAKGSGWLLVALAAGGACASCTIAERLMTVAPQVAEQLDADHDGRISQEELEAGRGNVALWSQILLFVGGALGGKAADAGVRKLVKRTQEPKP